MKMTMKSLDAYFQANISSNSYLIYNVVVLNYLL